MVAPVDDRHVDRGAREPLRGEQPGEARADDDDLRHARPGRPMCVPVHPRERIASPERAEQAVHVRESGGGRRRRTGARAGCASPPWPATCRTARHRAPRVRRDGRRRPGSPWPSAILRTRSGGSRDRCTPGCPPARSSRPRPAPARAAAGARRPARSGRRSRRRARAPARRRAPPAPSVPARAHRVARARRRTRRCRRDGLPGRGTRTAGARSRRGRHPTPARSPTRFRARRPRRAPHRAVRPTI